MKNYFLTHKNMDNKFLKSVAAAAVLATSSTVSADTPNSATTVAVRESSIDFNQNLTKINTRIALIQNKIYILEQKNDLSKNDRIEKINLKRELQKLTDEKVVIKQHEGQQLDKTVAIIDNQNKQKKETVAIKQQEGQQLDKTVAIIDNQNEQKKETVAIIDNQNEQKKEQLSIADKKLAALDRVSKILTEQRSQ